MTTSEPRVWAAALWLVLGGCATAPSARDAGRAVVAEGLAPVGAGGLPAARRAALARAERAALERAAGARLSARTVVAGAAVADERIVSRTWGVVRSYRVLEERRERDVVVVRIRAVVAPPGPGDPEPLPAPLGVSACVALTGSAAADAASAARQELSRRGADVRSDCSAASWRIAGAVALSAVEPAPEGLASCRAAVRLEAREAGGALVSVERSASALSGGANAARRQAAREAAHLAARALARALERRSELAAAP